MRKTSTTLQQKTLAFNYLWCTTKTTPRLNKTPQLYMGAMRTTLFSAFYNLFLLYWITEQPLSEFHNSAHFQTIWSACLMMRSHITNWKRCSKEDYNASLTSWGGKLQAVMWYAPWLWEQARTQIYTTNTSSSESSPVKQQLFGSLKLGRGWLAVRSFTGNCKGPLQKSERLLTAYLTHFRRVSRLV